LPVPVRTQVRYVPETTGEYTLRASGVRVAV